MSKYALRQVSPSKLTIAVGLALSAGATTAGSDIAVTTSADSGPGSLRQAIIDANASAGLDSINLSAISGETITLASELPQIAVDEDLQISGADVTLDGNGQSCFYSEADLEITDLTITNCTGTPYGYDAVRYGGAIEIFGGNTLVLENTTITGNTADTGGGVYVGGYAYVTDSIISNNDATGQIGGISATSSLSIVGSSITGNTTGGGAGGFRCSSLYGCDLTIQSSSITGNTAVEGSGGGYAYAKYGDSQGVSIVDSTISSNSAGLEGGGMAIRTKYEDAEIELTNSTVTANTAATGGGIYTFDRYYTYYGGLPGEVTFSITGSTIAVNESTASAGGGILSVNESAAAGYDTIFNIDNSIIQGNIAASPAADIEVAPALIENGRLDRATRILNSSKSISDEQRSMALQRITNSLQRPSPRGISEATFNLNYTILGEAPIGLVIFNPDGATTAAIGSDAQLGPLQDNGGPTPTHVPDLGSVAYNFIPDGVNGCGTTLIVDQRGVPRPIGPGCEAGSIESDSQPEAMPVPTMSRWSTGILALGLALMGWFGFRRRSSTVQR